MTQSEFENKSKALKDKFGEEMENVKRTKVAFCDASKPEVIIEMMHEMGNVLIKTMHSMADLLEEVFNSVINSDVLYSCLNFVALELNGIYCELKTCIRLWAAELKELEGRV